MTSLTPNRDAAQLCIDMRRADDDAAKAPPGLNQHAIDLADHISDGVLLRYADCLDAGGEPEDFLNGFAYAIGHAVACISSTATATDEGRKNAEASELAQEICKAAFSNAQEIIAQGSYSEARAVETGTA